MSKLVSILIPAYNAEQWIADTMRSALAQTWPKKEIIIVDDGSSDNTLQIARSFESKAVKLLIQENKGASAARNKALSFAQGDYIQWLDADNLLAPDKISQQLKRADSVGNPRVLLSSAWGRFFYRHHKARFVPNALWADLLPVEFMYRKLDQNAYMIPEAWLVGRALTEAVGPWNEQLSLDDDGEYFTRVIANSEMIQFVPQSHSFYRYGNWGSLSSVVKRSDRKLQSQFQSISLHISALLNLENSARTRTACLKLLQTVYIYFYPEKTEIIKKAQEMAQKLGGHLVPHLNWKYSVLKKVFGWKFAKDMSFILPACKMLLRKNYDRMLYILSV